MQTFKKLERLNNENAINGLFNKGKTITIDPFRLIWIENSNSYTQTLITVPKKNIKLASKRNVLKRRIKEAFRLNKSELYVKLRAKQKTIDMAIIYQKTEIYKYHLIEEKIKLLLTRLISNL